MTMEEITEENLEAHVTAALKGGDTDLLKEYMLYAARFEREDLMEQILEKSIQQNRLVEKLQDYGMQSPTVVPFLSDDPADFGGED